MVAIVTVIGDSPTRLHRRAATPAISAARGCRITAPPYALQYRSHVNVAKVTRRRILICRAAAAAAAPPPSLLIQFFLLIITSITSAVLLPHTVLLTRIVL